MFRADYIFIPFTMHFYQSFLSTFFYIIMLFLSELFILVGIFYHNIFPSHAVHPSTKAAIKCLLLAPGIPVLRFDLLVIALAAFRHTCPRCWQM